MDPDVISWIVIWLYDCHHGCALISLWTFVYEWLGLAGKWPVIEKTEWISTMSSFNCTRHTPRPKIPEGRLAHTFPNQVVIRARTRTRHENTHYRHGTHIALHRHCEDACIENNADRYAWELYLHQDMDGDIGASFICICPMMYDVKVWHTPRWYG